MMNSSDTSPPRHVWLLLDSRTIGGIETHVGLLAEGLRDRGCRPVVVFLADHGPHPLRDHLDRFGLPWLVLNGGLPGLFTALNRSRPDVIHTHGYKAGIFGRLAGRLLRISVVSTFHAGEPGNGRVNVYTKFDRLTAPLSRNIAVSRPILETLPNGATLVENFVKLPKTLDRQETSSNRVVAFVGRLSHEKGPDLFCRLAAMSGADLRFEIFGEGPMRGALEAEYSDRVVFHGMVSDMATHWSKIGLLCMPSRHEGLPMAALEAMAHGVPVAAFGVGDLPRLIRNGQSGWIADPDDLSALSEAVSKWGGLDDAQRTSMEIAARAQIAEHYSLKCGVDAVINIYHQE